MQRRDLALLATGAAVAAAVLGLYQWQFAGDGNAGKAGAAPPVAAAAATSAASATAPAVAASAAAASAAPAVPSVADSTARLAARLQKSGGSPADWQLLGKSYDFLGMKPEADAAYARGGGRPAAASADQKAR